MSKSITDSSPKTWFVNHGLPWSDVTSAILNEQGVGCADDLKFLEPDIVAHLFEHEKPIIKAKARSAWKELEGAQTTIRAHPIDVESQPVTREQTQKAFVTPSISPMATASIALFVLSLILGVVCVASTNTANNCSGCDYEKHGNTARGSGGSAIVLFAVATPLAFCAGRSYLNYKSQQQPYVKRESGNCCACPFGMAIAGWIIFAINILNAIAILVISFDENSETSAGLVISAVIGNTLAWSLMFAYSEMARKA